MNEKRSDSFYALGRLYAKNPKTFISIVISVLALVGYFFYVDYHDGERYKRNAEDYDNRMIDSVPVRTNAEAEIVMPADQQTFIKIVSEAQRREKTAENDMQRGGIKAERTKALCANPTLFNKADAWVGRLVNINANSDGKGVLSIEIAKDIQVKTMNNAFSDIRYLTLLEPGTELFTTVSQMKLGDLVQFSGQFFRTEGSDCIGEGSLSLKGKLQGPEFIFRFNAVAPYKYVPKSAPFMGGKFKLAHQISPTTKDPDERLMIDDVEERLMPKNERQFWARMNWNAIENSWDNWYVLSWQGGLFDAIKLADEVDATLASSARLRDLGRQTFSRADAAVLYNMSGQFRVAIVLDGSTQGLSGARSAVASMFPKLNSVSQVEPVTTLHSDGARELLSFRGLPDFFAYTKKGDK